jgi:hypothetical protein
MLKSGGRFMPRLHQLCAMVINHGGYFIALIVSVLIAYSMPTSAAEKTFPVPEVKAIKYTNGVPTATIVFTAMPVNVNDVLDKFAGKKQNLYAVGGNFTITSNPGNMWTKGHLLFSTNSYELTPAQFRDKINQGIFNTKTPFSGQRSGEFFLQSQDRGYWECIGLYSESSWPSPILCQPTPPNIEDACQFDVENLDFDFGTVNKDSANTKLEKQVSLNCGAKQTVSFKDVFNPNGVKMSNGGQVVLEVNGKRLGAASFALRPGVNTIKVAAIVKSAGAVGESSGYTLLNIAYH